MLGIKTFITNLLIENKKRNYPLLYAKEIGVNVSNDCRIIETPNWGSEPYLISIGRHVTISYGCSFITHDGGTWVFREADKYKDVFYYGPIVIKDNCFIGANVTIMPNVTIGNNCVIGACSFVNHNVPDDEVWAGVPAKYICKTSQYANKYYESEKKINIESFKKNKKKEILRVIDEFKSI